MRCSGRTAVRASCHPGCRLALQRRPVNRSRWAALGPELPGDPDAHRPIAPHRSLRAHQGQGRGHHSRHLPLPGWLPALCLALVPPESPRVTRGLGDGPTQAQGPRPPSRLFSPSFRGPQPRVCSRVQHARVIGWRQQGPPVLLGWGARSGRARGGRHSQSLWARLQVWAPVSGVCWFL